MCFIFLCRWCDHLPATVQICPIELPGRGRRFEEKAVPDVKDLTVLLAKSLPLDGVPYAIVGVSFGGILAYELAREIEAASLPSPIAVVLMASMAPQSLGGGSYDHESDVLGAGKQGGLVLTTSDLPSCMATLGLQKTT